MSLIVERDKRGQPFIEWHQGNGHVKRAWIQRRDELADWAGTGRYLNVGRRSGDKSGGCPVDFPIFGSATDEEVLLAFVGAARSSTGEAHL